MNDILSAHVGKLIEIANIAVEADELERLAKLEKADLSEAYDDFKRRNGIEHISPETPEWERMMADTKGEYQSSEAAKRKAYNAKRRLQSAIARFRAG